jgi:hypothetical protein
MTDNLEVRATLRYTTTRDFQRLLFVDGFGCGLLCWLHQRGKKEASIRSELIDGVSNGQRQEWMDWF